MSRAALIAERIYDTLTAGERVNMDEIMAALKPYSKNVIGSEVYEQSGTTHIFFRDHSVLSIQFLVENGQDMVEVQYGTETMVSNAVNPGLSNKH